MLLLNLKVCLEHHTTQRYHNHNPKITSVLVLGLCVVWSVIVVVTILSTSYKEANPPSALAPSLGYDQLELLCILVYVLVYKMEDCLFVCLLLR